MGNCPACGTEVEQDWRYCGACGHELQVDEQPCPSSPTTDHSDDQEELIEPVEGLAGAYLRWERTANEEDYSLLLEEMRAEVDASPRTAPDSIVAERIMEPLEFSRLHPRFRSDVLMYLSAAPIQQESKHSRVELWWVLVAAAAIFVIALVAGRIEVGGTKAIVLDVSDYGIVEIRDVGSGEVYLAEVPEDLVIYVGDEVRYTREGTVSSDVEAQVERVTKAAQAR